jgi:hypothetical protein
MSLKKEKLKMIPFDFVPLKRAIEHGSVDDSIIDPACEAIKVHFNSCTVSDERISFISALYFEVLSDMRITNFHDSRVTYINLEKELEVSEDLNLPIKQGYLPTLEDGANKARKAFLSTAAALFYEYAQEEIPIRSISTLANLIFSKMRSAEKSTKATTIAILYFDRIFNDSIVNIHVPEEPGFTESLDGSINYDEDGRSWAEMSETEYDNDLKSVLAELAE